MSTNAQGEEKFITVDGRDYPVPKIKFKALKQAFPVVMRVQNAEDPMDMASAAIEVISICMIKQYPDMTVEWLEDNLDVDETQFLGKFVSDIMVRAGLMTQEAASAALKGEAPPPPSAEAVAPSTEISTPSSQNLLPQDGAAETGTQ